MLKQTQLTAAILSALLASAAAQAETLDTRIGPLEFTHAFADGYPTDDTVDKLSPEFFEGSARIGVAALALLAGAANVSAVPPAQAAAALQASPNPFNGRVVISLAADGVEGPVAVGVYDLRGRRVGRVTMAMSEGRGEAPWDARTADGRALPAGVYLARVEAQPEWGACRITYVP